MLTRSVLQMEIRSGQVQPCVQPLSNESDADERDRYAVGQRSRLSLRLGHQIATSNREPVENVGWGVTPSDPKYEVQADTPEVIEPMTSQHYHGDLNYIDPRDDELFLNRFQKLKDQYEDPSLSTPSNSPRKVGQYEDSLSSTPTASPRKTNQYDDSMSSTATISPRRINLISVPQSHLQLTETIRCSSARPNASPVPGGRDLDNSPCPRDRESHISNSMTENNEERHDYPLYGSEDYESDKGVSLRPDYYDELEYNTQGVDMSQAYNNEDFDVTRTSLSYPYDERDDMPQQQGQTFSDPWSKLMSFTPDEQESSDQQDDSEPAVQSISAKASVCSDRSSRLDSHTYQTYTAGLLHSTDKSDDFQTLQRHFHNLEKITSMETKKSRPKSMDHALLELTDFTTEEELKQLSEELEDFKKTKKLPTRKQKPWTPHKDRGLMKREKSLGDIRAVYDKLEKTKNKPKSDQAVPSNESVKVKNILTHLETISAPDVDVPAVESKNYKAKIQDTKKGHEISVVHARCVETDKITPHQSNRQDGSHRRRDCPGSSAASPRLPPVNTVSPRRVERAIYGTHIDETNNQYEIYVKEKKKEYKDDMGVASLHVRCMSAPYTKSSALSIPELGTDPSQTCPGNAAESVGVPTENPRQQVESFPEDHQYVDVSVSPKGGRREEGRSRSTAYSPLHEELTEDVGEKAPIMHSFREDGNYASPQRSMGTNQPSREMIDQTEQQFYTGNDEWSRDGPDGYEMETSSLNNRSQMQPMEDVQFNVRNLRDLAKGNEFAQGKFAQRKPILEKYLADVWQRSARGELPQDIESDDQNMPETYGLIVHSHWDDKQQPVLETITTYPPLTSALTSDLDDDDSLSSRTSSTGTFIIKIGDNEERDMGDLSRDWVPSPTPYNRCQDDISTGRRQVGSRSPGHFYRDDCHPDNIPLNETYTKSKSQPNLSDSFKEQSLASQASKSQSNINRTKNFNDFALPRTISGNLKDVFKDYRDQKKFTRFESENGIQGSPTVNNNGSPESLKSYSPVQEMQFINTIGNEWAQEDAKLSQKNSQPPYRKRIQTQIPRGSTHHHPAQPLRHRPPPEVPFHPKGKGQPRPGDTPTRPSATAFKHQTTDAKRSPPPPFTEKTRKRREEEEQYRKKRLEQIYEEERKRKIKQEEANLEARKHSDFYLPSQKSPIPADRFEDGVGDYGAPDERRRGFQIQGKAKALYNFSSQNPRELGFRKGDVVYLIRQIDKHWFEGERHGRRGIFPINYVEVVTSIEDANAAAQQAEGHGVAKFNFSGQTNVELNIRKGDHITLLRRVDDNWFEGRMGQKQGIFPVQYVEVKQEPSTPLVTPAPSVIATPMTGRGTPELLSPMSIDVPTPPPQPSPGAFSPKSSSMSHYPYSPKPFSHSLSHSSPKLDGGVNPSQFNSLPTGLNTVPGAQTNGHHESFQNVGLSASFSPSKSSSAIDNNLDYRPKVTDDDLATSSYKALYAYKPQNDDELELWEGDQVYVMEKCDDGWFVGTSIRTGMFGTFPGNYVQRVQ